MLKCKSWSQILDFTFYIFYNLSNKFHKLSNMFKSPWICVCILWVVFEVLFSWIDFVLFITDLVELYDQGHRHYFRSKGDRNVKLVTFIIYLFCITVSFFISYPTFNWLRNQIHCIVHCICNIFLYFPNGSFMVCLYNTISFPFYFFLITEGGRKYIW